MFGVSSRELLGAYAAVLETHALEPELLPGSLLSLVHSMGILSSTAQSKASAPLTFLHAGCLSRFHAAAEQRLQSPLPDRCLRDLGPVFALHNLYFTYRNFILF